jgi:hypothetical protein
MTLYNINSEILAWLEFFAPRRKVCRVRFMGLTEFLQQLEQRYLVRLHRSNLTAKREAGPDGPESILERLERQGLARSEAHGTRRHWLVSSDALPMMAEQARSARPGPPSGAQRTLSAEELERFVRVLARYDTPAEHVREALWQAVGQIEEGVERVVIPVHPRRTSVP